MIPRWLISIPFGNSIYHYAGKRHGETRGGSVWVPKRDAATKFTSRDQAESYALLIATEEPEVLAKLEVVEYGEAQDGAASMDGGQDRR